MGLGELGIVVLVHVRVRDRVSKAFEVRPISYAVDAVGCCFGGKAACSMSVAVSPLLSVPCRAQRSCVPQ